MTATECSHGELVGMPCPPCDRERSGTTVTVETPGEWSQPFAARYPGTCTGCEFPIEAGQHIQARDTTDDRREHRHAGACAEED